MDVIIQHMKDCGWHENANGKIVHDCADPDFSPWDIEFDTWEEAIFACIETASGV